MGAGKSRSRLAKLQREYIDMMRDKTFNNSQKILAANSDESFAHMDFICQTEQGAHTKNQRRIQMNKLGRSMIQYGIYTRNPNEQENLKGTIQLLKESDSHLLDSYEKFRDWEDKIDWDAKVPKKSLWKL